MENKGHGIDNLKILLFLHDTSVNSAMLFFLISIKVKVAPYLKIALTENI